MLLNITDRKLLSNMGFVFRFTKQIGENLEAFIFDNDFIQKLIFLNNDTL